MTRTRRFLAVLLLTASMLASACGERAEPADDAPSAPPVAASGATPPSAAVVPDTDPTPAAPTVVLEDDALRVVEADSGSTQRFGLGSDEQSVLRALTRALPGPRMVTDGSGDCWNNTVHFRDADLVLHFSEGTLAGWYLGERGTLRTAAGYGIGSTRAELDAVADPTVGDEGLGLEFVAGSIVGGLESEAPDAKITDLRSGDTCVMG